MNDPQLAGDGTHIIPVDHICCVGRQSNPNALGELRWHPEKGDIFIVQFPNVSGLELAKYFGPQTTVRAAGTIESERTIPQWTGRTASGTAGFSVHCSVNVEVA